MRHLTLPVALAFMLLGATSATAAPLVQLNADTQYGDLYFTPVKGEVATITDWMIAGALFRSADDVVFPVIDGEIRLTSGRFFSFTEGLSTSTTVFKGPGVLDVDFTVELPGGGTHSGTFRGEIGRLTIVDDDDGGDFYMTLRHGLFDAESAALFGMSRRIVATPQGMYTDVFQGPMGLDEHFDQAFGELYFTGRDKAGGTASHRVVPEPGVVLLFGAAAAVRAIRRRGPD